jgi:hypothetical protein
MACVERNQIQPAPKQAPYAGTPGPQGGECPQAVRPSPCDFCGGTATERSLRQPSANTCEDGLGRGALATATAPGSAGASRSIREAMLDGAARLGNTWRRVALRLAMPPSVQSNVRPALMVAGQGCSHLAANKAPASRLTPSRPALLPSATGGPSECALPTSGQPCRGARRGRRRRGSR